MLSNSFRSGSSIRESAFASVRNAPRSLPQSLHNELPLSGFGSFGINRCRFSVIRAARRSCYVKSNLAVVDDASAATTLRTLFFAVFVPADLSFRVRAAFFAAELRFVGMGIPLMT